MHTFVLRLGVNAGGVVLDSLAVARDQLKREPAFCSWKTPLSSHVRIRPLNPDESVGAASSPDLARRRGPEKIVQAQIDGALGQAFTDMPCSWEGTLATALALPIDRPDRRAWVVASLFW